MTLLPKIKLKTVTSFPSSVIGGAGVDVVKQNGNFVIDLDYGDFAPPVAAIPAGSFNALLWDNLANIYVLAPTSTLAGSGPYNDAVSDGFSYGRLNATWQKVVPLAGGIMTGPLALNADPATSMQAATKQYVDSFAALFDALAYGGMQINGSMEIDQPNAGAAVVFPAGTSFQYGIDGVACNKSGNNAFSLLQWASGFAGYNYELRVAVTAAQLTVGSDQIQLQFRLEGYRVVRAGWGTAAAQPITVAFWVRSSVAGVLPLQMSDGTNIVAASVTINAPTVPQYVTATFPAQTTWVGSKTNGMGINFIMIPMSSAGINIAATNGNVFAITGLVVLPGIQAPSAAQSPLIMRPYDQELVTCQRYYEKTFAVTTAPIQNSGIDAGSISTPAVSTAGFINNAYWSFRATKRSTPTIATFNPYAANTGWSVNSTATTLAAQVLFASERGALVRETTGASTAGLLLQIHAVADIRL